MVNPLSINKISFLRSSLAACLLLACGGVAPAATQSLTITAYSSDGQNTGTGRLAQTIHLTATVTGVSNPAVNWTLQGAGALSSTGYYQAPSSMPSNTHVMVTGTLASDSSVMSSYSFTLENPIASVYSAYTKAGPLSSGTSNVVTVAGAGFVPQSLVLVNGSPVPTSFQSASTLAATVPVAAGAQGQMQFTAQNPAPGANTSSSFPLAITPLVLKLGAISAQGQNPGTLRLGLQAQFTSALSGSGSSAPLAVTWSLSGAGTLSPTGLYTAPTTMPSNARIGITAKLAANSAVLASYHISLVNPLPVITHSGATQVVPGVPTAVTINGRGFVSGTTLTLNGLAIPVTFISGNALSASIDLPAAQIGTVSLVAQNPDPGGSVSASFALPLGHPATVSAQVNVTPGQQVPDDFLGMSYEWGNEAGFQGTPAAGINHIYRNLLGNLMQGHSKPMLIRIGGGTADHSGEPNANTLPAYISMAQSMNVKFTMDVNLAANNLQLAEDQARYFAANMPAGSLLAIELGNEGDNYYRWARPSTYTIPDFLAQFSTFGAGIESVVPSSVGLMGPSWGNPNVDKSYFSSFEQQEQHVSISTVHSYAADVSNTNAKVPQFLLSNNASAWWPSQDIPYLTEAHQNGQQLRIGELNSIDRGGIAGVSNSFSAALWAVDTMFEYAKVGVDGVNFHGTGGCPYCQFTFGRFYTPGGNVFNLTYVNPLYYGLLMFQTATQNNARLLPVTVGSGPNVKVWATEDGKAVVRVLVLDKDLAFCGDVAVAIPGYATARVQRLSAPSYAATTGATFNGQSLDGSLDGSLVGIADNEDLTSAGGVFNVPVQPGSAVLLTLGN